MMLYGYKFTRCYGYQDNGTWLASLSDLTHDDLMHGLELVTQGFHDKEIKANACWPPNAKEFRLLCLQRSILEEKSSAGLRQEYADLVTGLLHQKGQREHWLKLYRSIEKNPDKQALADDLLIYAAQEQEQIEALEAQISAFEQQHGRLLATGVH